MSKVVVKRLQLALATVSTKLSETMFCIAIRWQLTIHLFDWFWVGQKLSLLFAIHQGIVCFWSEESLARLWVKTATSSWLSI